MGRTIRSKVRRLSYQLENAGFKWAGGDPTGELDPKYPQGSADLVFNVDLFDLQRPVREQHSDHLINLELISVCLMPLRKLYRGVNDVLGGTPAQAPSIAGVMCRLKGNRVAGLEHAAIADARLCSACRPSRRAPVQGYSKLTESPRLSLPPRNTEA